MVLWQRFKAMKRCSGTQEDVSYYEPAAVETMKTLRKKERDKNTKKKQFGRVSGREEIRCNCV